MKKSEINKKIKPSINKEEKKLFLLIKNFQKNNKKYLLEAENKPESNVSLFQIFTTINTKI